jgi:hypothetical protein
MAEQDPKELSDALEQEAEELARQSQEVQDRIEEARADWERKRADEAVPGAPPPEGADDPGSD